MKIFLNTYKVSSKDATLNKRNGVVRTNNQNYSTDIFQKKINFQGKDFYQNTTLEVSPLQQERLKYIPKLPAVFKEGISCLETINACETDSVDDGDEIKKIFPKTYGQKLLIFKKGKQQPSPQRNVGIILSGGQAPGGHNVITGLYDALKKANPQNKLYGFLNGPAGIIDGKYIEFDDKLINSIRNTGGFDVIGSGRTKLETKEQFERTLENCKKLDISAITIVGGDDSNTNAAVLAEWFEQKNVPIQVIGCPKTIDGDLKNDQIETSFGFDTATKTYSEIVGNIEKDAASAKKYWHFVKVMGRSASHVALEVALQTHPNVTILSEEVEQKQIPLEEIVDNIAQVIAQRAQNKKNYGVILIPEGLIEFIPEMKTMISDLSDVLSELEENENYENSSSDLEKYSIISERLQEKNQASAKVFEALPEDIKSQLLMDRDPHGNVQVAKIETEKLLISMIETRLEEMKDRGQYSGKFSAQPHYVGYEGRCAFPSNFDANYCYSLGYDAAALINSNATGYMACVGGLSSSPDKWKAAGIPLTMMMNMEKRHGQMKPVIKKALVELDGPVFKTFQAQRDAWALNDQYIYPGAIQYFGPSSVSDTITKTLEMERQSGLD